MSVQYIRGYSVHRGISRLHRGYHEYIEFSTSEGYHDAYGGYYDPCGGYQEYTRGCSVHWGDTMNTARNIMSTSGNIMMHVGGYYDACGGYQEYIRGCSVHWRIL